MRTDQQIGQDASKDLNGDSNLTTAKVAFLVRETSFTVVHYTIQNGLLWSRRPGSSMNTYVAPADTTSIQDIHINPPVVPSKPYADSSRLAPDNLFIAHSPPRLHAEANTTSRTVNGVSTASSSNHDRRRKRDKDRGRSGSRRGKGEWKKLLWVKQPKCGLLIPCDFYD